METAKKLLELKNQPFKETVLYSTQEIDPQHPEIIKVKGIPPSAEIWDYDSKKVFRHYFTSADRLPNVISTGLLDAEIEPYIVVHPGVRKEFYDDLYGTFLTTPEYAPEKVGLEKDPKMPYVDFTLPEGIGVIYLEPGIYLVPGKPAFASWFRLEYEKFKKTGQLQYPTEHKDSFANIAKYENEPDLLVPIRIKQYFFEGTLFPFFNCSLALTDTLNGSP